MRTRLFGGSQDGKVLEIRDGEQFVKIPVRSPRSGNFNTELYRRQTFGFGDTKHAFDFMVHEAIPNHAAGYVIATWIESLIERELEA